MKGSKKICILTYPILNPESSYHKIIRNFSAIMSSLMDEVQIISSNFVPHCTKCEMLEKFDFEYSDKFPMNVINFMMIQIKLSNILFRKRKILSNKVFVMSGMLTLPTISIKILGKKAILTGIASETNILSAKKNKRKSISAILERFNFELSDLIIVESKNVASFMQLSNTNKIIYDGCLYIKEDGFDPTVLWSDREYDLGYVGRFSKEKGVKELISAVSRLKKNHPAIKVLLAGDGEEYDNMVSMVEDLGLMDNVHMVGWISHDQLPEWLNQIKLLILPSFSEGLPNILLESMSCGTPVLANNVGGIPDVISDGLNGYIMKDNTPEEINEQVSKIMDYGDLTKISDAALKTIANKYQLVSLQKRWENNIDILETKLIKRCI
jgi:glycosyltransferase involved in cell wall biosynthesis